MLAFGITIKDTIPHKMDFIRKPEVLATANAIGTASIYFILSKRLNALTDEMDEIDNHLTSSIKKISENARSIQGITETFKDVLMKFEDHKRIVSNMSKVWKRLDEEFQDMNDKYDLLSNAIKELGGNVDIRKIKKKKKKTKSYDDDRRRKNETSESESSESEQDKRDKKDKKSQLQKKERSDFDRRDERRDERRDKERNESKQEYNSDEDFVKKAQEAKKGSN
jgi:chromosome segregation ATPase